jgi:hypothetical protein
VPQTSNLAAEFYVASLLYRLGYVTTLTLGNTKEIDLIVYDDETKKIVTIDVKGLNTTNWVMPNEKKLKEKATHFYLLVTFKNRFGKADAVPEVFVLPSTKVRQFWRSWAGRPEVKAISYTDIKNHVKLKGEEGFKQLFPKLKES